MRDYRFSKAQKALIQGSFPARPNQKVLNPKNSKVVSLGLSLDIAKITKEKAPDVDPGVKELHAKIGRLAMENDFLSVALGRLGDTSAKR